MKGEIIGIIATVCVGVASVVSSNDSYKKHSLGKLTQLPSDSLVIDSIKNDIAVLKYKNDSSINKLKHNYKQSKKEVLKKIEEIRKIKYEFPEEEYPVQLQVK